MKNCKWLSALLLAVLIMTVCLCLPVSALETEKGSVDVQYTLQGKPISVFSLNDENAARTVTITGYVGVNNTSTGDYPVVDSNSTDPNLKKKVYQISYNETFHLLETVTYFGDYHDLRITVAAGTVVDVVAPVYYSSDDYESVEVQGGGTFFLENRLGEERARANPNTAQLLLNGEPFGDPVVMSSGIFSFPSISLPLVDDIETLGYRFTYTRANSGSAVAEEDTWTSNFQMFLNDSAVFVVAETPNIPEYSGILETIVGWLRNLWDGITGIPDALYELFFPDEDVQQGQADDFNSTVADKQEQAEGVLDTMDTLETPDPEDIIPDIEVIISGDDYARYTDVFAQLLSNQMILNFFLVVASMAFVSYVLFGKKG